MEITSVEMQEKLSKAYSLTYGQNINPEAVPDMLQAIIDVVAYEERCRAKSSPSISEKWFRQLKTALKKAKL